MERSFEKGGQRPSEHYSRIAPVYDVQRFGCRCGSILNDVELRTAASLMPRSCKVLDVGAGTGRFSMMAATLASNVVALDASRDMVRIGLTKALGGQDNKRVSFVQADATSLPFPAASFDVVISVRLLSHYESLDPCLAEMARVLKPGGKIIIDVPHNLAKVYRRLVTNHAIQSYTDYFHPLSEIKEACRKQSIYVSQRATYAALPISLLHLTLCRHPRIFSTSLLRLIIASRKGVLSFVEGVKR